MSPAAYFYRHRKTTFLNRRFYPIFTAPLTEQVLLAYEVVESHLFLYAFGTHENFYRRLKKYFDR